MLIDYTLVIRNQLNYKDFLIYTMISDNLLVCFAHASFKSCLLLEFINFSMNYIIVTASMYIIVYP